MNSSFWTQAACKGLDTNLFFPEKISEAREAVRVCDGCPIKILCREYAEEHGEVGIWGGKAFDVEIEGKTARVLQKAINARCRRGHLYHPDFADEGRRCYQCEKDRKREKKQRQRERQAS